MRVTIEEGGREFVRAVHKIGNIKVVKFGPYWYHLENEQGKWVLGSQTDSPAVIRAFLKRGSGQNNPSKRKIQKRVSAALRKYLGSPTNPSRAKGRKVKGGRAVTLRNFTGTITRKANGQVVIRGKGRK